MKKKENVYFKLFISTLYLSAFTFGGGYVIVPLMKKKFVDELGWIQEDEMMNLVAIAQSSPGAIAVNASILVGWKVGGLFGAIVSALGTVLPPFGILYVISLFYSAFRDNKIVSAVLKAMMAGVSAVILDSIITMFRNVIKEKKVLPIIFLAIAFIVSYIFKINTVYVIMFFAVVGVIVTFRDEKTGKESL